MKRILVIAILLLVTLAALTFAGDFVIFRYRVSTNHNPYGSVIVYVYYSVAEKNNKIEFLSSKSEVDTCVHSLFPHAGFAPCWYLSRHTERQIAM